MRKERHHRKAVHFILQVCLRMLCTACCFFRVFSCWLARLLSASARLWADETLCHTLQELLGTVQGHKVYLRHRLACLIKSELFSYAGGTEWGIGQYLFEKM